MLEGDAKIKLFSFRRKRVYEFESGRPYDKLLGQMHHHKHAFRNKCRGSTVKCEPEKGNTFMTKAKALEVVPTEECSATLQQSSISSTFAVA